ncbi:transporter substrate-binding domain-containing protein [Pseudoduganella sp. FT55W]|uniref:Transporter substrate-binding domain-containing protein n=1 Tax=Duganella rivi TaxID=2666083 RepID=A0A7X4KAP3_9BURK|nr:transporter substrate-binding domain-containing protein [Duganella rivi]MYM66112.1 transporter substrate-binding domain-containing protein [Duganella rivi]
MKWLLISLMALTANACATTLRTAAQTEAEPKFIAGDHYGEPVVQGLCIDIFRAIEKTDSGLLFSGDQGWSPSARIDANLNAGLLDVACGMTKTAERQDRQLLEPALFSLQYVLLARADDTVAVSRWQDIIQMGGENVVLSVNGTGPSRQLSTIPALRVDAGSASVRQNLHKLMIGRGRFFYYRSPANHPLIREYCAHRQIRVLPGVMRQAQAYMLVGPHVPPAIQQRLSAALRKLKDSGELDHLAKKWQVAGSGEFCQL